MSADFCVDNVRLLRGDALVEGALVVRGGCIERVSKVAPYGLRRIGGRGRLLLPGAVDLHVHFRDMGQARKEDWATGSAAAAAGGVTTVLDMPNTVPPATTVAAFRRKLAAARRRSRVDFALAAGYDGANLKALPALRRAGAAAFGEIFMHRLDPQALERGLRAVFRLGALAIVHAESRACVASDESRPEACEREAVEWLARRFPRKRLHIAHASLPGTIMAARAAGFTAEVAPHHLLLSERDWLRLKSFGWCHPPLRSEETRRLLWRPLARGRGDALASDHAPHTRQEKRGPDPPPGVPGVETMVPLLLSAVRRGLLMLPRAVDLLSRRPAAILGLEAKGGLEPGKDADFMLVDLKAEWTLRGRELHSKCGWTPFEGWKGVFPEEVYLRGERVVREGEVVGKLGGGKFLAGKGRGTEPPAPVSTKMAVASARAAARRRP